MTGADATPQHVCASTGSGFAEFELATIEQSIGACFEHQVRRHPACLAVKTGTHQLTYADLDRQANRIAAAILARRGEGPEPIALLFDQVAPLIAAILAVLKIGKAYVALDPSYPPARLSAMLDNADAKLIVADESSLRVAHVVTRGERSLLHVDEATSCGLDDPIVDVSPDAVAYIFHTSGSTGQPKGVYDTHRNVLHNVLRYTNTLRIREDDRLTLLQSCSFSGSVSSLFCALLNGAATFPFDVRREGPRRLAEWLRDERITIYHSVPTIFRSLAVRDSTFPDVRCIRLEGDRSSRVDVDLFRRHFQPGCVLVNGLGATETGIARQFFIDHETEVGDGILPVGYPVRDMDVCLLDESGDRVEVGQIGEIAVRSAYLAAGYWRRPDLTEAAFRPDPAGDPAARIYRTGDMGRMRADGCLDYLGRTDFVLKVRGNRVEPAEIETALLRLPDVAEAVVTTFEADGGEVRLVAYLVPFAGASLSPTVLRRKLAETLPEYMIPSLYLPLDALPLDANGKLDRRTLPTPALPARPADGTRKPRGPLEEHIAHLFEDVLGLRQVGIDESFFDLGGDSLAAAEICFQLGSETGLDLPVSTLLRAPTVEELALLVGSSDALAEHASLVPIQPRGSQPPLFLVNDLDGRVLGYAELARLLGGDQPVWGLQSLAGADRIPSVAAKYLAEVCRVQPSGPYRLGGWCFGGVVAFEMAHQLLERGDEIELLALIGISAYDFPRLVSSAAWRRYERSRNFLPLLRDHLARARAMNPPDGLRYLVHRGIRTGPYLYRRAFVRRAGPNGNATEGPAEGALRANRDSFARYVPQALPGRITLILSHEETATYSHDPSSDWRGLATGGVDVHLVPGGHNEMLTEPRVRELARLLAQALAPARPID